MTRQLRKDLRGVSINAVFVKMNELTDIINTQVVGYTRNTIDDGDAFVV